MIRLLLLTGLLAGAGLLLSQLFADWVHPHFWLMLGFLGVLSIAGHKYLQNRFKHDPDAVMNPYLLLTGVRLLASLLFMVYFIKNGTPGMFLFLLNFFVLYFLYVGFEIHWVVTNLRRNFQ